MRLPIWSLLLLLTMSFPALSADEATEARRPQLQILNGYLTARK